MYYTVYELSDPHFSRWDVLQPLLMVATGLLSLSIIRFWKPKKPDADARVRLSWLYGVVFGILCLAPAVSIHDSVSQYHRRKDLIEEMRQGKAKVQFGTVRDFHAAIGEGTRGFRPEGFTVAGHSFTYWSDADGFHQMAASGGPIREGVRVRVTHIGNDIVKIEIAW